MEFRIDFEDITRIKKIQFDKKHENNLNILYEITKVQKEASGLERLMIICCFHIVREVRKKAVDEGIKNTLFLELSKNKDIIQKIKNMTITIRIDNIPKKILEFSLNENIYA
ncbi:MAG: hypothetical protein ACE5R7_08200 [Nitrosarchaeum sp.]